MVPFHSGFFIPGHHAKSTTNGLSMIPSSPPLGQPAGTWPWWILPFLGLGSECPATPLQKQPNAQCTGDPGKERHFPPVQTQMLLWHESFRLAMGPEHVSPRQQVGGAGSQDATLLSSSFCRSLMALSSSSESSSSSSSSSAPFREAFRFLHSVSRRERSKNQWGLLATHFSSL